MKVDQHIKQAIDISATCNISRSADAVVYSVDGDVITKALPHELPKRAQVIAYTQRWNDKTIEIRTNDGSLYWRLP